MAHPLTKTDARTLYFAAPRRAVRRVPGWAIFSAGVGLLVVAANGAPLTGCSESTPCGPNPFSAIELGLLIASMLSGWLSPIIAALAATVCALANLGDVILRGQDEYSAGAIGLLIYAVICVVCAVWWVRLNRTPAIAQEWASRAPTATLPPVAGSTDRPGAGHRAWAAVMIVLALASAGLGIVRQQTLDAEARTADVVNGTVVRHPDEFHIVVKLGDRAGTDTIAVGAASDYPVGSASRFLVTDSGAVRPVAEPGDASGLLTLGALLTVFAFAVWVRGRRRRRARTRLLTRPQPISTVFRGRDEHLFAGDSADGDLSFAKFEPRSVLTLAPGSALPNLSVPQADGDELAQRPVLLYGLPVRGSEVVLVDQRGSVVRAGRLTIPPLGLAYVAADNLPVDMG